MAQISSIKIGSEIYDLACDMTSVQNRLAELEVLNQHIYYDGYYQPIPQVIEEMGKTIKRLERDLYNNIADTYVLTSKLGPESGTKIEKSKQKFDLKIFEVIEAENPFLQNLI